MTFVIRRSFHGKKKKSLEMNRFNLESLTDVRWITMMDNDEEVDRSFHRLNSI